MNWRDVLRRARGDAVVRRATDVAADRVVAELAGRIDALAGWLATVADARHVPSEPAVPLEELVSVWSASETDATLQRYSHWRGGTGRDDESWLEIGRRTRAYVEELLVEVRGKVPTNRELDVLEWGPGGGSNLIALAPLARRYIGVDISAPNLAECERQARAVSYEGFVPMQLEASPGSVIKHLPGTVDVLVCTSVFQHFPSVEYGEEVLDAMRALSHPGTVGVIQVRYAERKNRPPPTGRYHDDYINSVVHPLPDFWWSLDRAGFTPQRIVDLEPVTNYAWFMFRATP